MNDLDRLLDALTTATETGHGYLPARKAVVDYFANIQSALAKRNRAAQQIRELAAEDEFPDGEKLI